MLSLNGTAPSALFLAGGGSKLNGLQEKVAKALDMDPKRVTVAGGHFKSSACSDAISLEDPEYTTPLGIAVSAGLGLISDGCQVTLNGARAKLFRSGDLSVMDLLMMNGYSYFDLLGKSGKPLVIQVDGRRRVFHGQPAQPAVLKINGKEVPPSARVHAGDLVEFTPAIAGEDCRFTAAQLARQLNASAIIIDGATPAPDAYVPSGSFVVVAQNTPPPPAQTALSDAASCQVTLNGRSILLPAKSDGSPYYVMDLLEHSGIDFKHVERPIELRVNGVSCLFQQALNTGDQVSIGYEDEVDTL